ncbi:hypothetical protein A3A38_02460 [Candidatus Kaiserbacteria bacterium RIFCSPLOWO2_01_FULL_53_17]|uniref:Uncharacterized protein n=1 Tax=Candidatus Kaiserbacteria bacterium RIFCSPLOWO2_01_FULL_53_17 TaxID=1798511 RepID=A0A1F6EHV1_9BACT|nr:MAG: hypothetical protein A3A38_02460 [Candidatus Kaiserbacteria bacterium RIFCSPLOWO2_01_FULL_53_17]
MGNFLQIRKHFEILPHDAQAALLKDLYNFSKDTRLFLEARLCGGDAWQKYLDDMERETIGKVYKSGIPGTPNGRNITSIITRARKAGAGLHTLMELERFAYRGFIEFLNEFGGGPDSFDDQACNHLEAYLRLSKDGSISYEERQKIFADLKEYLEHKNNMYTDSIDAVFEEETGLKVSR